MTLTKNKRFRLAVLTWLRADSDLVDLTNHTSSNLRIFAMSGDNKVARPHLGVIFIPMPSLTPDVDRGIFEMQALCVAYAASELTTLDIIGAVEMRAAQNATTLKDASFESNDIKSRGIQLMSLEEPFGMAVPDAESGVYTAACIIAIQFTDQAT